MPKEFEITYIYKSGQLGKDNRRVSFKVYLMKQQFARKKR